MKALAQSFSSVMGLSMSAAAMRSISSSVSASMRAQSVRPGRILAGFFADIVDLSFFLASGPRRDEVLLAGTGCEREVDDSSCEFRQHVVAQLAIVKSRVLPQHCKATIEDLCRSAKS